MINNYATPDTEIYFVTFFEVSLSTSNYVHIMKKRKENDNKIGKRLNALYLPALKDLRKGLL